MPRDRANLKVGYVLGAYPELSQTFVLNEIRVLQAQGVAVSVLAIWRGDVAAADAPPALYLTELGRRRQLAAAAELARRRPVRLIRALLRPGRHLIATRQDLLRLAPFAVEALRLDHLHAHFAERPAAVAAAAAHLAGKPFSFTAHAYDIFESGEHVPRLLATARFAATVSEYNRRFMARGRPRLEGKIALIRPGVDPEVFRRTRAYDPDGPIVGVGRLVEKKGFADLVRAAARARCRLPPVLIVGDGPERPALERLIADLDAPVTLVGSRPHDEVRRILEGASAFVLPCVETASGDRDGEPVVLKEAMALELPVCTTDAFGLPELVDSDRGVLVPPNDPGALADALCALRSMPLEARRALGARARRFVEEHRNLEVETLRLLDLFRRSVATRRAG